MGWLSSALTNARHSGRSALRLGEANATHGRCEHLVLPQRKAHRTLEHGQQQRQPTWVEALRAAAWRRTGGDLVGECLHFHQQRTLPFERGGDGRASHPGAPIGGEQLAGVGNADEALARHLEHAQLAGGPEAVLAARSNRNE